MTVSSHQQSSTFDISNFADEYLEISAEHKADTRWTYYVCPVCGKNKLGIGKEKGAPQCFSGGCEPKDIVKAVASMVKGNNPAVKFAHIPAKPKEPDIIPIPLPEKVVLSQFRWGVPCINTEVIWLSPLEKQTTYHYSDTESIRRTERYDANGKRVERRFRGFIRSNSDAQWVAIDKALFKPYGTRYADTYAVSGNCAIFSEGEKGVDICVEHRMFALSISCNTFWHLDVEFLIEYLRLIKVAYGIEVIGYIADNDDTGRKKADEARRVCHQAGLSFIQLDPRDINPDIIKGGDIEQVIEYWKDNGVTSIPIALQNWIDTTIAKEEEKNNPATKKASSSPLREAIDSVAIADDLAELLIGKTLFDPKLKQWYVYANEFPGVWSPVTEHEVSRLVKSEVQSRYPKAKYKTSGFLRDVISSLEINLLETKWEDSNNPREIPFRNGVLDLTTKTLREHSPSNRLLCSLPRDYNPEDSGYQKIERFLMECVEDNREAFDILNCFAAAVIRGKSKIQKYLNIIGLPGSGKGTFSNLLINLVGNENVAICDMNTFNEGRFDTYVVHGKKLVVFPDQQEYGGKIGNFLNLTGKEPLRYERKGKDATHFLPMALTLVTSNDPVFKGKNLNAIQRRQVLARIDNQVLIPNPLLLDELIEELPGWTNYLLSIPDSEIDSVLTGKTEQGKLLAWETFKASSSLAAWVDDHLIHAPGEKVQVGVKEEDKPVEACTTLFSSYLSYCKENNYQASMSSTTFSGQLETMCNVHLRWGDVHKKKISVQYFVNVRLRRAIDTAPTITGGLEKLGRPTGGSTGDPEPLPTEATGGSGDLRGKLPIDITHPTQETELMGEENSTHNELPLNPPYPPVAASSKGFNPPVDPPVTLPLTLPTLPSDCEPEELPEVEVQEGDIIELIESVHALPIGSHHPVISVTVSGGAIIEPSIENGKKARQSLGQKYLSRSSFRILNR